MEDVWNASCESDSGILLFAYDEMIDSDSDLSVLFRCGLASVSGGVLGSMFVVGEETGGLRSCLFEPESVLVVTIGLDSVKGGVKDSGESTAVAVALSTLLEPSISAYVMPKPGRALPGVSCSYGAGFVICIRASCGLE